MNLLSIRTPVFRFTSLLCTTAAALIGVTYLQLVGAPFRYTMINLSTLLISSLLLLCVSRYKRLASSTMDWLIGLNALILLSVGLWGTSLYGVHRWMVIYNFHFEPGLMLLPCSIMLFIRHQSTYSSAGMCIVGAATAIQPDRSMAGALLLGLLTLLVFKRNKRVVAAFIAALAAVIITWIREDRVPAAAYVEGVLVSALELNWLIGMGVLVAAILLLVPAIVGLLTSDTDTEIYAVFFSVWLTLLLAAAFGNYPTPFIGFGCSSIIGYILSLFCLPMVHKNKCSAQTNK